jgi:hypothetical protein
LNILAGRAFPVSGPVKQQRDVTRERPDIVGLPWEKVAESQLRQKPMHGVFDLLIESGFKPLFPGGIIRVLKVMIESGCG